MEAKEPTAYTYADYLKFPEDKRVELIEGIIYNMSPPPSRTHQKMVVELTTVINTCLKRNKKHCDIYILLPLMLSL